MNSQTILLPQRAQRVLRVREALVAEAWLAVYGKSATPQVKARAKQIIDDSQRHAEKLAEELDRRRLTARESVRKAIAAYVCEDF